MTLQESRAPAVASEFSFSYRCGVSECRVALRMRENRYVSSFMVFEPSATSSAHMAVAVVHGAASEDGEARTLVEDILTELYAHTGPNLLRPTDGEYGRLRDELAAWIQTAGSPLAELAHAAVDRVKH